ncbi:MAG: hypothetical protein NVS9B15_24640 [Acidobacteriaceae bacterium]
MEIHAPKAPHSFKEFFRELLTITAGILIALSLEGALEWNHHRHLVKEARENILSEIRENKKELENTRQDYAKQVEQIRAMVALVHALQQHQKTNVKSLQYIWTMAELHSTSWNTSANTGALSYMPYAEVKRYTEIYDLQKDYGELQQHGFEASLQVEGLMTLLDRGLDKLSTAELSDAEKRMGIAFAHTFALQQFSEPLRKRYDDALNAKE